MLEPIPCDFGPSDALWAPSCAPDLARGRGLDRLLPHDLAVRTGWTDPEGPQGVAPHAPSPALRAAIKRLEAAKVGSEMAVYFDE